VGVEEVAVAIAGAGCSPMSPQHTPRVLPVLLQTLLGGWLIQIQESRGRCALSLWCLLEQLCDSSRILLTFNGRLSTMFYAFLF